MLISINLIVSLCFNLVFSGRFRQKIICDIVLVADDVEVYAHRAVLAGCSPYFYAMFTKFEERKLDRVVIKEIDSLALELLIEYVYTSEILVTEDNVQVIF